ncbi:putative ribonuclease H protein, partial [Ananas comosus]
EKNLVGVGLGKAGEFLDEKLEGVVVDEGGDEGVRGVVVVAEDVGVGEVGQTPFKRGQAYSGERVLSLSDIFKWEIYYKWGNGCTIDFWSDRWSRVSSLQLDFSEVYNMTECKTLKVKDCLMSDGWNWSKILGGDLVNRQGLCSSFSALKDRIFIFRIGQGPDKILWHWNLDGRFTVKSAYSALSDGGTRDARAIKLWRLRIPLKMKVFCWLVLKKMLLTVDNLLKRG